MKEYLGELSNWRSLNCFFWHHTCDFTIVWRSGLSSHVNNLCLDPLPTTPLNPSRVQWVPPPKSEDFHPWRWACIRSTNLMYSLIDWMWNPKSPANSWEIIMVSMKSAGKSPHGLLRWWNLHYGYHSGKAEGKYAGLNEYWRIRHAHLGKKIWKNQTENFILHSVQSDLDRGQWFKDI